MAAIRLLSWMNKDDERRVPKLIPVLGSQLAGDVSHKPGGRLPTFGQTCSYPRNP